MDLADTFILFLQWYYIVLCLWSYGNQ